MDERPFSDLASCDLFGSAAGLVVSFYSLGPDPPAEGDVWYLVLCGAIQCSVVLYRCGVTRDMVPAVSNQEL